MAGTRDAATSLSAISTLSQTERLFTAHELNQTELQCEQPHWNYVQNYLGTNRPSFAAANQVLTL